MRPPLQIRLTADTRRDLHALAAGIITLLMVRRTACARQRPRMDAETRARVAVARIQAAVPVIPARDARGRQVRAVAAVDVDACAVVFFVAHEDEVVPVAVEPRVGGQGPRRAFGGGFCGEFVYFCGVCRGFVFGGGLGRGCGVGFDLGCEFYGFIGLWFSVWVGGGLGGRGYVAA